MFIPCGWLIPLSPQEIHGSKSESSPIPLFPSETFTFLTQLKFETTIFSCRSSLKIANYKVSHQWINPFMHKMITSKMSFLIIPKKVPWKDIYGMNWKVQKFQLLPIGDSTKLALDGKLHSSGALFWLLSLFCSKRVLLQILFKRHLCE